MKIKVLETVLAMMVVGFLIMFIIYCVIIMDALVVADYKCKNIYGTNYTATTQGFNPNTIVCVQKCTDIKPLPK